MVDYRLLHRDETDAAARLHRVAGALVPGYDPTLQPWEDTAAAYRQAFERGPIWGAFEGDAVVGQMVIAPGWIEHLYVAPWRHGQGIGRALLAVAQAGQDDLQLYTYEANLRARRFYEAAGFVAEEHGFDPRHEQHAPNVRYRWRHPALTRGQWSA